PVEQASRLLPVEQASRLLPVEQASRLLPVEQASRLLPVEQASRLLSVEVINFGVHGYGTAQELITLRTKVWDYNPDIVILAFFVGNDLINNSKKLESDLYRPFFVYRNGSLVEDLSFRQLSPGYSNSYAVSFVDNLPDWLVANSRVLQVIKKVDLDNKKRQGLAEYRSHSFSKFNPPVDEVWEEAWNLTEDLILLMRDEVEEKGAKFAMAVIASPLQVHPNEEKRRRKQEEFGVKDWFYVGNRLDKLGDRYDFPAWDLTEPFLSFSQEKQVCLHGFEPAADCGGHWNAEGHKLAGEIISRNVCGELEMVRSNR
ncbi:MAG: SGNH/GDSL hydrolase family protein, partial [Cyanobacteriota bacterium]|nr:SGNH/GDSL hydrolase family protein [Cyanobacteriota bacterium]